MTETIGGSDVGMTETRAAPLIETGRPAQAGDLVSLISEEPSNQVLTSSDCIVPREWLQMVLISDRWARVSCTGTHES